MMHGAVNIWTGAKRYLSDNKEPIIIVAAIVGILLGVFLAGVWVG